MAVGTIGMNYSDFLQMDADAFDAVATAYHDQDEYRRREEWERMRILASISIQPHISRKSRNSATPEKLLPLPWDHEKHSSTAMSAEEQRQRMKQLVEQLGDKTV